VQCDSVPKDAEFIAYGMDFGFATDPTTLIGVFRNGEGIYLVELLYEKGMITSEIIDALKKRVNPRDEIWCDSSDPRLIEEIYRAGFNAKPVKKGPDSIRFGISVMQNYKIHVTKKSQNLINEMYSYQWAVDKHQHTTDVPEGGLDHCIDAARYVAMMKLSYKASNQGKYVIRIK
jgi:phage terminase large subunit